MNKMRILTKRQNLLKKTNHQIEILKLKITIIEIKISLEGFNSRFEQTE